MKEKKMFFAIALVFALIMGGAGLLYRQLGQTVAAEQLVGREPQAPAAASSAAGSHQSADSQPQADASSQLPAAPDFTVYDSEGNEVHLSDFAGKPIVLNFWASFCGPCQLEMPHFQEKYLELGEDIQFLMINAVSDPREGMDRATAFLEDNGYTFPVFYDTYSHAASVYGAYSLPTTFFIDANGGAAAWASGAIDAELLQQGIDMIT